MGVPGLRRPDGSSGGTLVGTTNAALNKPATASSLPGRRAPGLGRVRRQHRAPAGRARGRPAVAAGRTSAPPSTTSARSTCAGKARSRHGLPAPVAPPTAPPGPPLKSVTGGDRGVQSYTVTGNGRYIRVNGTARATGYGYSLWEVAVYTGSGPVDPGDPGGPIQGGGDLGSNVHVFDPRRRRPPSRASSTGCSPQQEAAQFGDRPLPRCLFKPGTYNVNARRRLLHLDLRPRPEPRRRDHQRRRHGRRGLVRRQRHAELLALHREPRPVPPTGGTNQLGGLAGGALPAHARSRAGSTSPPTGYGWAGGGYIADSARRRHGRALLQQQWYTRDSTIGGWTNGVWNMVFSGVVGRARQRLPRAGLHDAADTPDQPWRSRILYLDGSGDYRVFLPSQRTNARGVRAGRTAPPSAPRSR